MQIQNANDTRTLNLYQIEALRSPHALPAWTAQEAHVRKSLAALGYVDADHRVNADGRAIVARHDAAVAEAAEARRIKRLPLFQAASGAPAGPVDAGDVVMVGEYDDPRRTAPGLNCYQRLPERAEWDCREVRRRADGSTYRVKRWASRWGAEHAQGEWAHDGEIEAA